MSDPQRERVAYWLDLSAYDLETARAMLKTKRYLYVGFMCHQVIEKTLKACYVKNRKATPPFHHNLVYFAKESGVYELLSEEQKKFIDLLQPLNVAARYPSYREEMLKELTSSACKKLLTQTRELHEWLRTRL